MPSPNHLKANWRFFLVPRVHRARLALRVLFAPEKEGRQTVFGALGVRKMEDEDKFLVKKIFGCLFIASACFALTHGSALLWTINKSLTSNFIHGHRHLFVYLLSLLSVDFFLVITYPLEAYYRLKEDWPFGRLLCSFYKSVELFYLFAPSILLIFLWNDYYLMITKRRSSLRSVGAAFLCSLLSVAIAVGLIVPAYFYTNLRESEISAAITKISCLYEEFLPYQISWSIFCASFAVTYLIPLCCFTCYAILTENQRSRSHYRRSFRPYRKWLIAYSLFIFASRAIYWLSYAVRPLESIYDKFHIFIIINILRFVLSPFAVCFEPFFCVVLGCNVQNF